MSDDSAGSPEADPELQAVLDALDDPDCRAILRELDAPLSARDIMDACDLSQTTTYRKLGRLREAGLVEEETELREDGHHTTLYSRAFAGVFIGLHPEERFDVTLLRSEDEETADERLASFWAAMREELR